MCGSVLPIMQWLIYFVIQLPFIVSSHENNVCENVPDYKTIHTNKNCRYDPNVLSDLPHIVERNGYPLETHKVTTKDGYILTVYRFFDKNSINSQKRQPVIIQHGLGGSAVFWVLQNKKSLAFFLYDNGYDVWLPTFRGATDSMEHVSLKKEDSTYWKFGFHEMAIYDIPAIIDHISNNTKNQKGNIIYIGHSMGCTVSYIYSSIMRDHAERHLKGIISLAPVAYLGHVQGLYAYVANYADTLEALAKTLGITVIGADPSLNRFIQHLCSGYPNIILCTTVLTLGSGLSLKQTSVDLIPVVTSYFPVGLSIQTLIHFSQLINSGKFRQYDYGKRENWLVYNSSTPPDYEVWKITLPVYLFVGNEDFIATKEDVNILEKRLTSARKVERHMTDFAHNDFFLGKNFDKFYKTLISVMKKIGYT